MRRYLPVAVAAVLLAGCRGDPVALRDAAPSTTPTSTSPGPTSSATPSPSRYLGDSPPPGSPTSVPGPTSNVQIPAACGLITQVDLVTLTRGEVTLTFPDPPQETNETDSLYGKTSSCFYPMQGRYPAPVGGGIDLGSGVVKIRYSAGGGSDYFPLHPGDIAVPGLGDDAMLRNTKLYVRIHESLMTMELAIPNPKQDPGAQDIVWLKQLAKIVVDRL
jgi:hypothetical protein